ncbi:hypothetical protein J6590_079628 [Homalodisca vitripennis]|nr:hypothetical protein J6590_079628 [Homalodisca vitripennis]
MRHTKSSPAGFSFRFLAPGVFNQGCNLLRNLSPANDVRLLGNGAEPVSTPTPIDHLAFPVKWVRRLSQDNQIKQRRAWLLLGQVTAERSCPCKRPACPAIGGGSEVTFKPLVPRLSVREGFLALTSPDISRCNGRHSGPGLYANHQASKSDNLQPLM